MKVWLTLVIVVCLSVCVCVSVSICPWSNKCTTDLYLKTMRCIGFLQHSKEIECVAFAGLLVREAKKTILMLRAAKYTLAPPHQNIIDQSRHHTHRTRTQK